MSQENYLNRLKNAADKMTHIMSKKGFELSFGGEGALPKRKPSAPTDVRSEFLANRALGDWAEKSLAHAIRSAGTWDVAHYGQSDSISAGDEGFREFYLNQLELVRLYGKRPDLLIFEDKTQLKSVKDFDISMFDQKSLDDFASKAIASIEVRSSKVEAIKYMSVRKEDRAAGRSTKATRDTPSFTIKAEDLVIVYRWLERYKIPQTYCQVFFDSVWAMNVLDIFEWISTNDFKIDNPDKSQGKATILIPITEGTRVGDFDSTPSQTLCPKVSRLGRHDTYIEPIFDPTKLHLNFDVFKTVVCK